MNGIDGFTIPTRAYSAEFKESAALWIQQHNKSSRKFRIATACTVSKWERLTVQAVLLPYRISPEDAR